MKFGNLSTIVFYQRTVLFRGISEFESRIKSTGMALLRQQLVKQIVKIDRDEESRQMRQELEICAKMDVKAWLENKIIETRVGFWLQVSMKPRFTEFALIDSRYPKKIAGLVSQPVEGFRDVKYYFMNKEVDSMPIRDRIMLGHTDPNQACHIIIDSKIKYTYVFASERARSHCDPKLEELYPILYTLACRE